MQTQIAFGDVRERREERWEITSKNKNTQGTKKKMTKKLAQAER